MPRRIILSATDRKNLLAIPDNEDELVRHYAFSESDLSLIRKRRTDANRLGFAAQLCLLRFPGQGLLPDMPVAASLLRWVGQQLQIDPSCWSKYAKRQETRRDHMLELRAYLGLQSFHLSHFRHAVKKTTELALQTDKGIVLAANALETLRHLRLLIPPLDVIERICSEAITKADRLIYAALTDSLSANHYQRLDQLLMRKEGGNTTWLGWLRQPATKLAAHARTYRTSQAMAVAPSAHWPCTPYSPKPFAQDCAAGRPHGSR